MSEYNQYVTAVNKIFDYVAKMKAGWNSQDNFNYIENLEEYKQVVIGNADVFKTPATIHEEQTTTSEQSQETTPTAQPIEQSQPAPQAPTEAQQPTENVETQISQPQQLEEAVQSEVAVTPENLSQKMEALGND